MKQLLLSISFGLLLIGFFACEKGTSIITNEIKNLTDNQKVDNNRFLVAIVLADETLPLEKTDQIIQKLLIKEQANIDRLNNNIGEPAFWDLDESNTLRSIESSTIKMDDLQLKKEFATLSHLTTFKSTPVEIFNYDYSLDGEIEALARVGERGIGVIIITSVGRPPSGFSF